MLRLNIFKLFAKNKPNKVKRHDIRALFINEKLTDIEIKTIYSMKDKLNMLIKPKNINVKNGFLIRNVKGINSFGVFIN